MAPNHELVGRCQLADIREGRRCDDIHGALIATSGIAEFKYPICRQIETVSTRDAQATERSWKLLMASDGLLFAESDSSAAGSRSAAFAARINWMEMASGE
eukprot:13728714-Alexandrium_andersonii.AAC.1